MKHNQGSLLGGTWMEVSARVMVMATGSTLCTTSGGWKRRMYSGRCAAGLSFRLVCMAQHRSVTCTYDGVLQGCSSAADLQLTHASAACFMLTSGGFWLSAQYLLWQVCSGAHCRLLQQRQLSSSSQATKMTLLMISKTRQQAGQIWERLQCC